MPSTSAEILERFRLAHGKDVNLTLRHAYSDLLERLGSPHENLPPTIIVGGTNGKGSTCAFLRTIIEATGKSVHVYTSPHLVHFHERIRIAGKLITEEALTKLLLEAEKMAATGGVSIFEVGTAVALAAFARTPADITLLEVGLGGRLDATNVVPAPIASIITRLSFDHRDYLGNTMTSIAREKAGIIRSNRPCFSAPQPSTEALQTLRDQAAKKGSNLVVGGEDWRIEVVDENHFRFVSERRTIEALPRPALVGTHQLWNAGLAIASLETLPFDVPDEAIRTAMNNVEWKGRLQKLEDGPLVALLPKGWELWLDGGHNDSAAEVLAAQMHRWMRTDGKPLDVIYGMLSSKQPEEFLGPIHSFVRRMRTLYIQGEVAGTPPEKLAEKAIDCGIKEAEPSPSLLDAINSLVQSADPCVPSRILCCGSLYLVGCALKTCGDSHETNIFS